MSERTRRLSRVASLFLLATAGCQPFVPGGSRTRCIDSPLPAGEVYVGPLVCSAMRVPGGEGRGDDLWVGNAWFRAVLRHPDSALTVPGVGGGTLVDAAPWGMDDGLHEVIPLVGGGWLDTVEMDVAADRVVVGGNVVSLPGRPAPEAGTWREVVWIPHPDEPWLDVVGAQGLWLHPSRGEVFSGQVVADATWGHDGQVVEDLGGLLRIGGSRGLLVAPTSEAATWWAEGVQRVTGEAPGAEALALFREGALVGRIPLATADFDVAVPDDVDGIRAEAPGRAPGPVVPPAQDLRLAPGPPGTIDLSLHWEVGPGRPVEITWEDHAGRSGTALLPPRGGRLDLGAGDYRLGLAAGPTTPRTTLQISVEPATVVPAEAMLRVRFDPGRRVLADLDWFGSRSAGFRGTDRQALERAVGAGLGFVVVAPENDVAAATEAPLQRAWLRWRNGVRLVSPEGWSVAAWSWTSTVRHGGHGAPPVADLSAADALAAAWGGPGTDRFLLVDLPWLLAAGNPWDVLPPPDLVALGHPGAEGPASGAWDPWFAWLDAQVPLVPVGPRAWVEVDDPRAFAGVDIEQGLTHGWVTATTGGLVTLSVDGLGPGGILPRGRPDPEDGRLFVHLTATPAEEPYDHLALVVDGEVVRDWALGGPPADVWTAIHHGSTWVIAVAWSEDGDAWAATGPVWLSDPTRP